jgi:alpha-N-arabinofuranosidase
VALRPSVEGPSYRGTRNGEVHTVDASAILDGDRLHVFATNRSLDSEAPLEIHLADRAIRRVASAEIVSGPDAKAANTWERPDVVRSEAFAGVEARAGRAHAALPALSVAALTFELEL